MVYGTGTRSYNRSTEKREMDRQRAAATKAYEAVPRAQAEIWWSACTCRSFRHPHDPERHFKTPRKLRAENDWRTWDERGEQHFEEWERPL